MSAAPAKILEDAAAVAYTEGQTNGYFTLCNVTNGIDITTGYNCKYPAAGLGSTANDQNISSVCQSLTDDGYRLNIWVCCARQGVSKSQLTHLHCCNALMKT